MVKSCFFQFYNLPRRVQILGDAGAGFADFDFDPGNLIPSMGQDDPAYVPELDKSYTRAGRAQWLHKNFTFTVTPNSLLAISQISRKLLYLQLRQLNLMDKWTLWEVLEIPNAGSPPGGEETVSERLQAEMMESAMQMMMSGGMPGAPGAGGDPAAGGGSGQSGPGRPDTYQSSPTLLNKNDGPGGSPRQTISSSGSGGG
jgi:hypothetical protein